MDPLTLHLRNNVSYSIKAESDNGCTASAVAVVKVYKLLYMANAFTPNRDHRNDVFRIPPDVALSVKEFSVFDRWGKKIFSTKEISRGCDGTVNGIEATGGVYIYTVNGTDINKAVILLKGSFVLIR